MKNKKKLNTILNKMLKEMVDLSELCESSTTNSNIPHDISSIKFWIGSNTLSKKYFIEIGALSIYHIRRIEKIKCDDKSWKSKKIIKIINKSTILLKRLGLVFSKDEFNKTIENYFHSYKDNEIEELINNSIYYHFYELI